MAVLAPSLVRLRNELNARWPHRDHTTDGWIGDPSHATTGMPENGGSDHNPNRRNVVDAIDIDKDGINTALVVAAAIRHPAVHYVIWNRRIWSTDHLDPRTGLPEERKYTGKDPHTDHIHVSVKQAVAAENNTKPWGIASGTVATPVVLPSGSSTTWVTRLATAMPLLARSPATKAVVRKLQTRLDLETGISLTADGVFGPATEAAVKAYQKANSLTVDGKVGPKTWGKLIGTAPTVRAGDEGWYVKVVQALVSVFGHAELAVDSKFGPRTDTAVREFQKRFGLGTDGIVGPKTWTALYTR